MTQHITWPIVGLITGVLFGFGLSVAQMTDPERVIGFLDVLGNWDPSLLFTMAGAILTTTIGYRFVLGRGPVFGDKLHLPTASDIDQRLLGGSAIFGIGWGIAGYCPGPAITGITNGLSEPIVFLLAMMVGSQAERWWMAKTSTALAE